MTQYVFKQDMSIRQAFLQLPHVKEARKRLAHMLRTARKTEPKVAKLLYRRLRRTNAQLTEAILNEGS